jgi:hypothetical protein
MLTDFLRKLFPRLHTSNYTLKFVNTKIMSYNFVSSALFRAIRYNRTNWANLNSEIHTRFVPNRLRAHIFHEAIVCGKKSFYLPDTIKLPISIHYGDIKETTIFNQIRLIRRWLKSTCGVHSKTIKNVHYHNIQTKHLDELSCIKMGPHNRSYWYKSIDFGVSWYRLTSIGKADIDCFINNYKDHLFLIIQPNQLYFIYATSYKGDRYETIKSESVPATNSFEVSKFVQDCLYDRRNGYECYLHILDASGGVYNLQLNVPEFISHSFWLSLKPSKFKIQFDDSQNAYKSNSLLDKHSKHKV